MGRDPALGGRRRLALAPALDRLQQLAMAAVQGGLGQSSDRVQLAPRVGPAAGELHQDVVGQQRGRRPVRLPRRPLAPLHQLAGHRSLRGLEPVDPGQPGVDSVGIALVAGGRHRGALLAGPLQAAGLDQPGLQLAAQLQQVGGAAAGVLELLRGEGAPVPLGECLPAGQRRPEHLPHQLLVALLSPEAHEAGGDLGVEHVGDVRAPGAAQDRHVLTAGVDDHLDGGIGERRRQGRRGVVGQRIEHLGAHAAVRGLVGHRHLGQAEHGPIPTLGHELGVDREAPGAPRLLGDLGDHGARIYPGRLMGDAHEARTPRVVRHRDRRPPDPPGRDDRRPRGGRARPAGPGRGAQLRRGLRDRRDRPALRAAARRGGRHRGPGRGPRAGDPRRLRPGRGRARPLHQFRARRQHHRHPPALPQ